MPNRNKHEQFDVFLADKGILLPDGRYGEVHDIMDKGTKIYGSFHRKYDPVHEEKGLRAWILFKYSTIGQDRATDWLRAGLGHICLDEMYSRFKGKKSWDKIFNSAYRSMAQRSWDRSYFKPR